MLKGPANSRKRILSGRVVTIHFAVLSTVATGYSQADFSMPDTICIDKSVTIENLSRDAETWYWNFCSGNLIYDPGGDNIPNPGTLNGPAFIDFAEDNGNYYAFITNHTDGTLVRNSYGSNFLNPPLSQNLGNFGGAIPLHAQGIQVIQDNGNWYVFIVGGQRDESAMIRLDFGNVIVEFPHGRQSRKSGKFSGLSRGFVYHK